MQNAQLNLLIDWEHRTQVYVVKQACIITSSHPVSRPSDLSFSIMMVLKVNHQIPDQFSILNVKVTVLNCVAVLIAKITVEVTCYTNLSSVTRKVGYVANFQ
jgi:hypothetical protein